MKIANSATSLLSRPFVPSGQCGLAGTIAP